MKEYIAAAIEEALKEQGKSKRGLALEAGVLHPQIIRLTNGSNYNIDTLEPVLCALGLTIKVVPNGAADRE